MMFEPVVNILLGVIIGSVLGALVAGFACMEREHWWTVCLRLPANLHDRLRRAARDNMHDLKTEIIDRLEASFLYAP